MNGVHDMGGMHGMGPITYEKDEPVFRAPWEGRVWALSLPMERWGSGRWRGLRYELEQIPPADYLRMSYYERWFHVLVERLLRTSLVSRAELEMGRADPAASRAMLLEQTDSETGSASSEDVRVRPRYKAGEQVRASNINPMGHTRLPRYARGKHGTILRDHGVWSFQDTDTANVPIGKPQHVYTVRFTARELWGEQASPRDSIHLDLWEDYLERA